MEYRVWQQERWEPVDGVPLSDRGFRFGMHCFATLRVRGGCPQFWQPHLESLAEAVRETGWGDEPDPAMPAPDFHDEGVLRLYATAGDGTPAGEKAPGRLLAAFEPGEIGPGKPLRTCWVAEPLTDRWSGWKTGRYADRVTRLQMVRSQGFDEGLLLLRDLMVSGWCLSNLLLRLEGEWWTPEGERIRRGTTRRWLEEEGLMRSRPIRLEEISQADALGACNAVQGIRPVIELDGRKLEPAPELADWSERFESLIRS